MTDVVKIYDRVQGSIDIENQTTGAINDWLTQTHGQTSATFDLARKLSKGNTLFEKDITYDDVDEYEDDVSRLGGQLPLSQSTLNQFNIKIGGLRKEQAIEVERREQLIAEREVLKQELAEATTREELAEAERELRELSPQSIGGIKSGRTRRVPKAFATLFE